MILNNYWEWQRQKEWAQVSSDSAYNSRIRQTYIKSYSGAYLTAMFIWFSGSSSNAWQNGYNLNVFQNMYLNINYGFAISSSNTDTAIDDYNLEDVLTHTNGSISYNVQNTDSTLKQIITCNGTNGTNNDITIRKVGIWKQFWTFESSTIKLGDRAYLAIVDLETPITVPSGKGFTIVVDMTEQ